MGSVLFATKKSLYPLKKLNSKKDVSLVTKKLGISGFLCKCNNTYCSKHRYSFEHDCMFNHKKHEQEKLKKNNPKIEKEKFERI